MQVTQPLLPSLGPPNKLALPCLALPCLAYPTLPYPTHGRWFQDFIPMQEKVASAPCTPLYVRPRACKSRGCSVPRVLLASQSSVPASLRTRVKCRVAGVLTQGEPSSSKVGCASSTCHSSVLIHCYGFVLAFKSCCL